MRKPTLEERAETARRLLLAGERVHSEARETLANLLRDLVSALPTPSKEPKP